jgi:D-alanyl-D-alanine carboxypeptidase
MVRATVRLPATLSRPLLRSLLVLGLAVAGGVVWFGVVPLQPQPPGPVAVAAPGETASAQPAVPSAPEASPSPAGHAATPGPTPSPTAVPTASPAPTPATTPGQPAGQASATPSRPSARPTGPKPTPFSIRSVVGAPASNPATGAAATRIALTERLDALREAYGLPGVSAAILFADGSMWRGSSGLADIETERPVTRDTQFAIASISKTFLAARILTLIEQGEIGLDDAVNRHLPDLGLDDGITVRRLLDHTSGLHDYFYDEDIDEALLADRARVWTTDDVLGYIGKPYFRPGKGWQYSNTNYVILGLLAEELAGEPLSAQFRSEFLEPLGLDHTHYQAAEDPRGQLASAYRFNGPELDEPPIPLGDGTEVVPFTSVVTAAGSAGSLASTAEDLVVWARALYDGDVLTPRSRLAMVADVQVTAPFEPSIPYGLGVQAATVDGRPTLGHSGRLLGSRTVVRWLPDERIAIAVLTNQSRADPNLVVRALIRVALGIPSDCSSCQPAD